MTDITAPGPPIATVRPSTSIPSRIVTLVAVLIPPVGVLCAMGLLWEVAVRPVDAIMLVALYIATGLGITVGFHRLFSHRSFKAHPVVRAALAILGSMTIQGPVTQWVTDHRKHHALSDQRGRPALAPRARRALRRARRASSTPTWAGCVTTKGMERGRRYGRDLYDDRLIRTHRPPLHAVGGPVARDPVRRGLRGRARRCAAASRAWCGAAWSGSSCSTT